VTVNLPRLFRAEQGPERLRADLERFRDILAAQLEALEAPPMAPFTNGLLSAPASGTVLAEGLPATGSQTLRMLMVSAEDDATVRLEWRDAADTSNVFEQTFQLAALEPLGVSFAGTVAIGTGERWRLVLVNGVAGDAQATLFIG
jgi:hypothetical protein